MTSCILTVIKNEHEYLDEWIKYHLDLGIDHIFIFEDIDSDSHKEICKKYDNVTLNCISIVLNEDDKRKTRELKLTKKQNPQDIYFTNSLLWIKKNYQYDWCFVIDVDEFITTYKPLLDILNEFRYYDGIVLQWKIFGANGNVSKPNYNNGSIISTYTKESNYIGHNVIEWTTKTCYNLNTFEKSYYKNNHQPSDKCKWCKTDFSNIRTKIVYDKIYIKHYMTKSWEEYINKRKRGYFMGFARTIDMFFKINPDMLSIKNKLTNNFDKEILVVLPYKQSGAQGRELELTLSLWKKFCTFDYHFIVIGEFDNSLKKKFPWVEFIYYKIFKKWDNQYTPHIDIINKFDIIMQNYSQIYNGFIYMTDDEYAIKPFTIFDILQTYYHSKEFFGNEKAPKSYWSHDKWKTRKLLDKENLPHINYTTHYPCFFEFDKFKEICNKFNLKNESYVFDDVYFNYFKHEEPIKDDEIRLGIWNNKIYEEEFQKALDNPNIKFCCNSVEGWSKNLENSLELLLNKQNI